MKWKLIAALVFCAVLVGVVIWATSIAVEIFRTASRSDDPNTLAFVFVFIAFIALTLAIIILVWAFNKNRSKKKLDVKG